MVFLNILFFLFCSLAVLPLQLEANQEEQLPETMDAMPMQTIGTLGATADQPAKDIATSPSEIIDPSADIYLNFEDATLGSILEYLAEQKKINILPHEKLESEKVTLTMRKPLNLAQAWDVMLTLMESRGLSIIQVGKLYRVVESSEGGKTPLPFYSSKQGIDPENLPDSDLVVRYVYFFKNLNVSTAQGIIETMIETPEGIQTDDRLGLCIIVAKSRDIKTAMSIIKSLDEEGIREEIKIISLEHRSAQDVASFFKDIIPEKEGKDKKIRFATVENKKKTAFFSSDTRIIEFKQKNALILLGSSKNIKKIENFIKKFIDVPITSTETEYESRIHIKELKYIKAKDIQGILTKIVSAGKKKKGAAGKFQTFSNDIVITAEEEGSEGDSGGGSGNRLAIACNKQDWKFLNAFINKFDQPKQQIAIETLILILSNDQVKQLDAYLETKRFSGKSFAFQTQNIDDKDILTSDITSAISFGNSTWLMIQNVLTINQTNIIGQPYLLAESGQECTFSYTNTQRFKGEVVYSKANDPDSGYQKYDTKNATKGLTVTPKVNRERLITLDITLNYESIIATKDLEKGLGKENKEIKTKAVVAAGEVLILGGLAESTLSVSLSKTPILGDISLIGNLFKARKKDKREGHLYFFIRPTIIEPDFNGVPDEYTQLKIDYAKYQLMKKDLYIKDYDPVQRWFFRPSNSSIKGRIADAASGRFGPIDKFTSGRDRPQSVNIKFDPYYRGKRAIAEEKEIIDKRKAKIAAGIKRSKKRRGIIGSRVAAPQPEKQSGRSFQEVLSENLEELPAMAQRNSDRFSNESDASEKGGPAITL